MLDDIDYYNRVHGMLHICTSSNNRLKDSVDGFGYYWDSPSQWGASAANQLAGLPGIAGGASANACFKPLCGNFNQSLFIPLMWCPITLEFEIVSNAADAVVEPIGGGTFEGTSASANWTMQDIRLLGDIVTLDNGLQNSYAQHVFSGKSLPINYGTHI